MDKSCHSSADSTAASNSSTTTTTNNGRNQYLKHLNKLSHKISKPIIRKPSFDAENQTQNQSFITSLPPPPPPPPQQHQPPVYNINKSEFRHVVQKLTGSPAHERFATPPPIHPPKPQSSRLQRIRPPPLAHVGNRPSSLLNDGVSIPPIPPPSNPNNFNPFGGRLVSPLSPLPPFPTIHTAAESPVSAYMRCFQNSTPSIDSTSKQFSGYSPLAPLVSPRWNNLTTPPPLPLPQQQGLLPSPRSGQFQLPSSPLPFGCSSPRSPYPLLSPGFLFSPSSGQLGFPQFPQFPLSPRVPVTSPRWRNI